MMPKMCRHHASVYRTRAAAIRHLPHGHKALAREARTIATAFASWVPREGQARVIHLPEPRTT